jgi:hypothetical protein
MTNAFKAISPISPEAELLIRSAKERGLIPADWPNSATSEPRPSEIDDAVGALRVATNAGRGILDALEFMPENLRGYAILAFLPGVVVGPPVLSAPRAKWDHKFNSSDGDHWRAQRKHLIQNLQFDLKRIESLDRNSDEVLFNLQDPDPTQKPEQPIKGLVVGYVQSGKTANYAATVAKAFDAGYRLVIVLAGIHNELRRQTQLRLENDLGLVPSDSFRTTARENGQAGLENAIYKLTTAESDSIGTNITPDIVINQRVIAVIKKNVAVMKRLLTWLPADYDFPVLVIDDEADQASVNSNPGDDWEQQDDGSLVMIPRDRTATNRQIVELIEKFSPRVSYVGYTATPYANVFIDSEDVKDIYPKDFIIPLPKPDGYFGPSEFFGNLTLGEESEGHPNSYSMVKILDQSESKVFKDANREVLQRRKDGADPRIEISLPSGLQASIKAYLIAASLFHQRYFNTGNLRPTSMLVQASHIQEVQLATKRAIEDYLNQFRRDWRYDETNKEMIRASWRALWLSAIGSSLDGDEELEWQSFEKHLDQQLGSYQTQVVCLNRQSEDRLDYESMPDFNGIVVGGNKLSRGLTLEGLLTSYFVRETNAPRADTLSQMGRFFGYRQDYADLVKVYTTDSLLQDFRDISIIEEELREELVLYSRTPGKTPADFGPRVALRGRLMPTSKLGTADKAVSLSGSLLQTSQLIKESMSGEDGTQKLGANKANLESTIDFLEILRSHPNNTPIAIERGNLLWKEISWPIVKQYLLQYKHSTISSRFEPLAAIHHTEAQIKAEEQILVDLDSGHSLWNVAVIGTKSQQNGTIELAGIELGMAGRSLRDVMTADIGSLINPLQIDANSNTAKGDEVLDLALSEEIISQIVRDKDVKGFPYSLSVRLIRKHPLLCVYPLATGFRGNAEGRAKASLGEILIGGNQSDWPDAIVGLSIVFPRTSEEKNSYLQGNAGRVSNDF